ncbi:MAG: phage head closure protein [Ruminococcus sp.]|nr:phage head closure protein [Ruminococcus sp.]
MINPGLMRDKITIQHNKSALDSRGNPVDEWENYYTCRAYANSLFGSEYYAARQVGMEETVKLTMRYSPKLDGISTADYRLIFRNKTFDIDHIDNVRFENNTMVISAIYREGEISGGPEQTADSDP